MVTRQLIRRTPLLYCWVNFAAGSRDTQSPDFEQGLWLAGVAPNTSTATSLSLSLAHTTHTGLPYISTTLHCVTVNEIWQGRLIGLVTDRAGSSCNASAGRARLLTNR